MSTKIRNRKSKTETGHVSDSGSEKDKDIHVTETRVTDTDTTISSFIKPIVSSTDFNYDDIRKQFTELFANYKDDKDDKVMFLIKSLIVLGKDQHNPVLENQGKFLLKRLTGETRPPYRQSGEYRGGRGHGFRGGFERGSGYGRGFGRGTRSDGSFMTRGSRGGLPSADTDDMPRTKMSFVPEL